MGWYFAGLKGLSLLGEYSDKLKWEGDTLLNVLALFSISFGGHAAAVALMAGPTPLAFFVAQGDADDATFEKQLRLRAFTGCTFAMMFAITILFTTKLAEGGHASETARMHMRYYNLFFPLCYLVLATQLGNTLRTPKRLWIMATFFLAAIVSVQFGSLKFFVPLDLDAPELTGIIRQSTALAIFGIMAAVSIVAYVFRPSSGAQIYLCTALPFLAITSSIVVTNDLKFRTHDDIGDAAGKKISLAIGSHTAGMGLFGDVTPICQVMFYAGNPSSFLYPLAEGVPVPETVLQKGVIYGGQFLNGKKSPPEMNWAVVFGNRRVPINFKETLSGDGWRLFNISHVH